MVRLGIADAVRRGADLNFSGFGRDSLGFWSAGRGATLGAPIGFALPFNFGQLQVRVHWKAMRAGSDPTSCSGVA